MRVGLRRCVASTRSISLWLVIAVEVQLAVFVLVEVSLHGLRNDESLEHITALGVVQQLFRRMNPEKIVEQAIVVEIDVVRR